MRDEATRARWRCRGSPPASLPPLYIPRLHPLLVVAHVNHHRFVPAARAAHSTPSHHEFSGYPLFFHTTSTQQPSRRGSFAAPARGLSVSATTWGGYARQAALAARVASHVLSLVMCLDTPPRDRSFSGGCALTSPSSRCSRGRPCVWTAVSSRCHRLTGPACPQSLRTWRQRGGRAGSPERRDRPPCQAKKAAARKCRSHSARFTHILTYPQQPIYMH